MFNFSTKARHNLPTWQLEFLEKDVNPDWNPADSYAPISVAFLAYPLHDAEGFYAIFYSEGEQHSVKYYNHSVFDVPAPTLKAA